MRELRSHQGRRLHLWRPHVRRVVDTLRQRVLHSGMERPWRWNIWHRNIGIEPLLPCT